MGLCFTQWMPICSERNSFQVEDGSMVGTTDLPNVRRIVVLQCSLSHRQALTLFATEYTPK